MSLFHAVEKFPLLHQIADPAQLFPTSRKEAMGTRHIQNVLFLFLLGASSLTCTYRGGKEQLGHKGISGKGVIWATHTHKGQMLYLIFFPVAQNLYCHKGISMSIEEDPSSTFNWTTEKVETCDNGALCQESVLLIKSGKMRKGKLGPVGGRVSVSVSLLFPLPRAKPEAHHPLSFPCLIIGARTAVLATKGCISEGTQAVTFAQHSPPPGIITVSYSNYCEDSLCNNQKNLVELWRPDVTPGTLGGGDGC